MSTPLPVQDPKDKKEDKLVWRSGISTWAASPPLYWCLAPRIDLVILFFSFPKVQSRILKTKFYAEYFLTDLVYFPHCKLWKILSRGIPPQTVKMYKNLLSATGNFSVRPPAAQHQKSENYNKLKKKKTFSIQMDSRKIFIHIKIPISSNFHFSIKSCQKINFATDTQFITPDLGKLTTHPKTCYF